MVRPRSSLPSYGLHRSSRRDYKLLLGQSLLFLIHYSQHEVSTTFFKNSVSTVQSEFKACLVHLPLLVHYFFMATPSVKVFVVVAVDCQLASKTVTVRSSAVVLL